MALDRSSSYASTSETTLHNAPSSSSTSTGWSNSSTQHDAAPITLPTIFPTPALRSTRLGDAAIPAAITHTTPSRCQFCPGIFSARGLIRHTASVHNYRCERGCEDKAFLSRRDRDRHYSTSRHRHQAGDNLPPAGFQCGCGKSNHRKDKHQLHLQNCRVPPHGCFRCIRCNHDAVSREEHLVHLRTCELKRGRKPQKTMK